MAENKQYITQVQKNGSVMIAEEVIATIAAHAIGDVEGINTIGGKPDVGISEIIAKKNWGKGLKITIGQDNEVYIDCNVVINYGQSVVAVAKAVQEAVASAIESVAGVTVAAVNVNICGIARQ